MEDSLSASQLADLIRKACDEVDEVGAQTVAEHLHANGLVKKKYLIKVQERDLTEAGLNLFQAREVEEKWKSGPRNQESENSRNENCENRRNQDQQNEETSRRTHSVLGDFQLNWNPIYQIRDPKQVIHGLTLKAKLKKGKRLTPYERLKITEEVVKQVRHGVPHADRKTFDHVYDNILIIKYKKSFEETLGAEGSQKTVVGGILKQMKDKFDNDKRPTRNQELTPLELEAVKHKAAYGCVKWRCIDLPDNETEESLRQLQEELKTIHATVRETMIDKEDVKKKMKLTYKVQRELINRNTEKAMEEQRLFKSKKKRKSPLPDNDDDVDEDLDSEEVTMLKVLQEFPFLFTNYCMEDHHLILTQIDVSERLENFLATESEKFLQFFSSSSDYKIQSFERKMNRQLKREKDDAEACKFIRLLSLIRMLTVEFCENFDKLMTLYDQTDMENIDTDGLPPTPHLAASGNSFLSAQKFFLAIDKTLLSAHDRSLKTLAWLYTAHFMFNLNYDTEAQITMEFIQRCIFKHDPEKGNKRPTERTTAGRYSSRIKHPILMAFLKKVNDYLCARNAMTSEEEEEYT